MYLKNVLKNFEGFMLRNKFKHFRTSLAVPRIYTNFDYGWVGLNIIEPGFLFWFNEKSIQGYLVIKACLLP
jgi:hypothetical protein